MGEHRSNPRAHGYAGELPEVVADCKIAWLVVPSKEFEKRLVELQEAGIDGPVTAVDSDKDVVIVAQTIWAVPSKLTQNWPASTVGVELARMPLTEFKARHKANFAGEGMTAAADSIKLDDEKKLIE